MDYLNPLQVQSSASATYRYESKSPADIDHSMLAMRAAKKMRRTKYKEKTGHKVCQHLLQMISESDDQQPAPRTVRRFHGLKHQLQQDKDQGRNREGASLKYDENGWVSANDRQFSLSF